MTMYKTAALLMVLIFFDSGNAMAKWNYAFTGQGGYRVDQLDWNIAADPSGNATPNILSELTWKDIEILTVKTTADGKFTLGKSPYPLAWQVKFDYGWILAGENQDSDYAGNNRTLEWSRSNNQSDNGNVLDFSFAIGMNFIMPNKNITITPLIGYSYHEQDLTITDGRQTVSVQSLAPEGVNVPPVGPIPGLDSTYEPSWHGPWIGGEISVTPLEKLTVTGLLEIHALRYRADLDWNLRNDLAHPVSFQQRGDGIGLDLGLGAQYHPRETVTFMLNFHYKYYRIEDGTHRAFSAFGGSSATRLNEVNWESAGISAGIRIAFF